MCFGKDNHHTHTQMARIPDSLKIFSLTSPQRIDIVFQNAANVLLMRDADYVYSLIEQTRPYNGPRVMHEMQRDILQRAVDAGLYPPQPHLQNRGVHHWSMEQLVVDENEPLRVKATFKFVWTSSDGKTHEEQDVLFFAKYARSLLEFVP